MKKITAILGGLSLTLCAQAATAQSMLETVQERGELRCAVGDPTPGWHSLNEDNQWVGFGVDYCRAVATAVLGDPNQIVVLPVGWAASYETLRSGEADLATTSNTFKIERDTSLGVNFPLVYFFDGTSLMVRRASGVTEFGDLAGGTICYTSGSANEAAVASWFRKNNLEFNGLAFDTMTAVSEAYAANRCDGFATEPSTLIGFKLGYTDPDEHVILEDLFSVDGFGPMVAEGDELWNNIVRTVVYATIFADTHGVNSSNVDDMLESSTSTEVLRLLGREAQHGANLGLDPLWAANVIRAVGSYSEIFDRNLGAGSAIQLEPGLNRVIANGGLLHSPTF